MFLGYFLYTFNLETTFNVGKKQSLKSNITSHGFYELVLVFAPDRENKREKRVKTDNIYLSLDKSKTVGRFSHFASMFII